MDWRLISAVTLAGASFSMVAFGVYTLRAADAVPRELGRAASPLAAPSLTLFDMSAAGTVRPERGVSFVPVASGNGAAAPLAEGPAPSGAQVAVLDGASPVPVADLPVLQDMVAKPSWRHRHHVTWNVGHRARFCTVLRPCGTDRKHQVAVRHTDEPHNSSKIALMLGVGF
jgi:hypothetical protein